MIVLAVSGHQDEGKTSSIRKTTAILLHDWQNNKKIATLYKLPIIQLQRPDIRRYILLKNGIKISICSGGDDRYAIHNNFAFSRNYCCDILIIAVRFKWGRIPQYFYDELKAGSDFLIALSTVHQPNANYSPNNTNIVGNNYNKLHDLSTHNILFLLRHILQTGFQCNSSYLTFI